MRTTGKQVKVRLKDWKRNQSITCCQMWHSQASFYLSIYLLHLLWNFVFSLFAPHHHHLRHHHHRHLLHLHLHHQLYFFLFFSWKFYPKCPQKDYWWREYHEIRRWRLIRRKKMKLIYEKYSDRVIHNASKNKKISDEIIKKILNKKVGKFICSYLSGKTIFNSVLTAVILSFHICKSSNFIFNFNLYSDMWPVISSLSPTHFLCLCCKATSFTSYVLNILNSWNMTNNFNSASFKSARMRCLSILNCSNASYEIKLNKILKQGKKGRE